MTIVAVACAAACPAFAADTAGATFRHGRHWNSQLFVTQPERSPSAFAPADTLPAQAHSTVGARLSGRLSRTLRLQVEVRNLLEQRPEGPAFEPAEPRGLRIQISKTF